MSELLKRIVERDHVLFRDHIETWQEAVRQSTLPLVKTGYVTEDYYRQIVSCIETYGPYVVLITRWLCLIPRKMQRES